jgi:hypothetical protein
MFFWGGRVRVKESRFSQQTLQAREGAGWSIKRGQKSVPLWLTQHEGTTICQRFISTGKGTLDDKVSQGTVGSGRGDLQSPLGCSAQAEIKFFGSGRT